MIKRSLDNQEFTGKNLRKKMEEKGVLGWENWRCEGMEASAMWLREPRVISMAECKEEERDEAISHQPPSNGKPFKEL
jgi:hypothetical protein